MNFPGTALTGVTHVQYDFHGAGGAVDNTAVTFEVTALPGISVVDQLSLFEDYVEAVRVEMDSNLSGSPVTINRTYLGTAYQDDGPVTL